MRDHKCPLAGVALVVLLVIASVVGAVVNLSHTETMTCTVTEKDRTRTREGGSDARVYTSDCGTLQVADSLWDGTWSSSDTYASIQPGHRYEFHTRGYRLPLLSMFPNIVNVQEVG